MQGTRLCVMAMLALAASPAAAAPAAAHVRIEQDAVTVGDPARYVVRAQRCKDEFLRELRLADGRVPGAREAVAAAPNPAIEMVLGAGGVAGAQVLAAAINVCLGAQGLPGVRAAVSAEPLPIPPLE